MRRKQVIEIEPDEIFLDSSNLPDFDQSQFEGRFEKPIRREVVLRLAAVFVLVFGVILWKSWMLQGVEGAEYANQGEQNRLKHGLIFAERGVIVDRNGEELVWNVPNEEEGFSLRQYIEEPGFAHILGYTSYPQRDSSGFFFQEEYIGREGVERAYNNQLRGDNGIRIVEISALGEVATESVVRPPQDGNSLALSIDKDVQKTLYQNIADISHSSQFEGGAGVIMDVRSGEVLAMTSFPEYDSNILSRGAPAEKISEYVASESKPFLNRAISGLYTPGSIVKPIVAIGALEEKVITPEKEILSTGQLILPNPFNPDRPSIFRDWRAHGYTDMVEAIGVSSDVYFYEVGGGFEEQQGIGINNIEKYSRLFGLAELTGIDLPSEIEGVIPNPNWKAENFPGDPWRVGNTYHTSIGQYGFLVTPIQAVVVAAALGNGGVLRTPTVLRTNGNPTPSHQIPLDPEHIRIAQEGMRYAVTNGTAQGLSFPDLHIAAKTGTAEVGAGKSLINSWIIGFYPYEDPQYAFVVLMERAPAGTLVGAPAVVRGVFDWMRENKPQYTSGT